MQSRVLFHLCLLPALFIAGLVHAMPYTIVDAAKRGDDHAVRKLLEENPELALATDAHRYTPLDWASTRGHWIIVQHLLDAGAPVDNVGGDGGTLMHKACHHECPDIIARFLDKGADLSHANQWGRTPLHVAVRRGHKKTAALLLDRGADPNLVTKEGWTALHVAYKAGQPALVDLLLARGADAQREDNDGNKPQDLAMTRPAGITLAPDALAEYMGHYDLGGGYGFKIWLEDGGLHIQEFAPDDLYPIGTDEFYCVQEPWRVTFQRDESGEIASVDVAFLRRTVCGRKRVHPQYVGSQECKVCHLGGAHGGQYISWVTSRHAAAYWRLETDWGKLLPQFRPHYLDITEPVQEDRCLLCHLTAAQDPEALLEATYRIEEGVGCETCHGPGSLYMDPDVMADREQFLANGGIVPDEKTCQKCHRNPERFDFATWWLKIDHTQAGAEGSD